MASRHMLCLLPALSLFLLAAVCCVTDLPPSLLFSCCRHPAQHTILVCLPVHVYASSSPTASHQAGCVCHSFPPCCRHPAQHTIPLCLLVSRLCVIENHPLLLFKLVVSSSFCPPCAGILHNTILAALAPASWHSSFSRLSLLLLRPGCSIAWHSL